MIANCRSVDPLQWKENYIRLIAKDWMLVTAGDPATFNTMTANWGGVGYLWNKPVVFIFIRPQRYTFEFVEREERFTLSFLPEKYRQALVLCGRVSGRDSDKVKEAGLTPEVTETGNIVFREARLMMECRKLYAGFLRPEEFVEAGIVPEVYAAGDFHKVYVAEIEHAWERNE